MTQGFNLWAQNIITKGNEQLLDNNNKTCRDSIKKDYSYIADLNEMCPIDFKPTEKVVV